MLDKFKYNLYRLKYRYGRQLPLKAPVDISFELNSNCNMSCQYCYHGASTKLPFTKGYMNIDLAKDILLQAADLGVHSFKPNFRGESTMHPRYTEILLAGKSLASGSTFIDRITNSNFKIPWKVREDKFIGLASLTKVKVSYDSFDKGVFETQRAGGNHDLTTENIDLFYNHPARIKSETEIVIQAVRTLLNKDEDIEGMAKKRWPEASISIRDMVEGRTDNDLEDLTNKTRDLTNRRPCLQASVRMIIHHDGRVAPCCPSYKSNLFIGKFPDKNLSEIFNGYLAKKLRKELKNKKAFNNYEACKNCSSFESYKGFKPSWSS